MKNFALIVVSIYLIIGIPLTIQTYQHYPTIAPGAIVLSAIFAILIAPKVAKILDRIC